MAASRRDQLYVPFVGLPKVLLKLEELDAADGARGLRYGDGYALLCGDWNGIGPEGTDSRRACAPPPQKPPLREIVEEEGDPNEEPYPGLFCPVEKVVEVGVLAPSEGSTKNEYCPGGVEA